MFSADSSKYLTKYASFLDCNNEQCCAENLREHYHCLDLLCMGENKVLCKKEEIIRHLKWHKKRNESLTHGFLRFSSNDDCSGQFQQCTHNRKQTHYHCLQQNCDKVYISTSDVQMHSNYHRKDSAIFQEGWVFCPFVTIFWHYLHTSYIYIVYYNIMWCMCNIGWSVLLTTERKFLMDL